jgi:trehalose 6-phosphate phosphatase
MEKSPSINQLLRKFKKEKTFLFLDYDGTLAKFAPNPDVILPDEELIAILKEVKQQKNIRVAIISGRKLGHIRELVPISGVWLAGSYGLEMIDPQGNEIHLLEFDSLRPGLEIIKPIWQDLIKGRKGFYLEDKGWSLAIHANGSDQQEVCMILEKAKLTEIPKGFHLQSTDNFIEIYPPEADKGLAVEFILEEEKFGNALPIFLGDDPRDESAFKKVRSVDGLGILISETERETQANYYLESPEKVRIWLREIAMLSSKNY